jgi:hypothetical protein
MIFGNLRPRTCIVREEAGDPTFEFDFKKIWFRVKRLPPVFWRLKSGIVPLAIFHVGEEIDAGHLEIDRERELIVPRGFDSCFRRIRNEAVRMLYSGHLCFNDRMSFEVDNGAYHRLAPLQANPFCGMTYVTPSHRAH